MLLFYNKESMRCKNCGWPNKPGEMTCSKCGSPLEAEAPVMENDVTYRPQPLGGEYDGLKKTISENVAMGGSLDAPAMSQQSIRSDGGSPCPKCGYLLRPDVAKCPNCGSSVGSSQQVRSSHEANHENERNGGFQRRPTRMDNVSPLPEDAPKPTRKLSSSDKPLRGTINPYMMNYQPDPMFVLQPLQRMNERRQIEATEHEGSEVILTRDNTEPGNPSITSQEQAVVTHSDGHWYIENRSEQKTTFVHATNKIELHDGDIILLGNRLFEFKEQ